MEKIKKEIEKFRVSKHETAEQAIVRLNNIVEYFNQNKEQIISGLKKQCEDNDEVFEDETFYTKSWGNLESTWKPFSGDISVKKNNG